jgi:phosphoribosylanthranilate isomerase
VNATIRVKICGITNREDALAAVEAGADALGFNLFPGSRRHVRIEDIAPWLPALAGQALRVAVMVNPSIEEVLRVRPHFDAIQLHGQETPALCAAAAAAAILWKAFPLTQDLDVTPFHAHAILIDSSVPGAFGGTGALIDLDRAALFVQSNLDRPIWLSGGLNPANVAAAVEKVRPHGVDVATGVEVPANPRRKALPLLRAFVAAARRAAAAP